MLLSEFIRRTGFPPEFADTLSSDWQEGVDAEALPECFTEGFFGRYAKKLSVPTPFAPELPGSNLARFMEEVYLTPMPEVDRAGLFFVYGRSDGELSEYPADNSLRRAFRRLIDAGRPLRMGGMFILTADLDRFGTGTYRNR